MLTALHVENYVLIDSLDIRFPEGLVIITGQTGAGKSILLGALSLVMGVRADASLIGTHGDSCVVEAEFDVEDTEAHRSFLEENDIEPDGGHLILRRTVAPSGRSRAFVNDSPVPASVLQELSRSLVDIHSQHETRLLTDRGFQLDLLDRFAGNAALRDRTAASWRRVQSLRREVETLTGEQRRAASERDYNESVWRQLEEAGLQEGEWESLDAELSRLTHAEEIKQELTAVEEDFSPSDEERMNLDASLKDAARRLARLARYLPSLAPLSQRIESARIELDDICGEVSGTNAGIELSAARLQAVEERMSLLHTLMNRHGVREVRDLVTLRDSLAERLSGSADLEARIGSLRKELSAEEGRYAEAAALLHEARAAAAPAFSETVCQSLRFLELEQAVFSVSLADAPAGESGTDAVLFLFSASGRQPVELARCASGGELSRIMLSLKEVMARYTEMPTLVFDEIDTGVSGSAADRMGSMICSMGEHMQVFAITHLPQVAAKGRAHYLVTKDGDVTSIRRLDEEQRVMEVARMLSGSRITEAAVENARSLLG